MADAESRIGRLLRYRTETFDLRSKQRITQGFATEYMNRLTAVFNSLQPMTPV
jgi:hypothetical protein